jgi:hypothetical protein
MASASGTVDTSRDRSLRRSRGGRLPDQLLKWGLTILSIGVIVLIAYFFLRLIDESRGGV